MYLHDSQCAKPLEAQNGINAYVNSLYSFELGIGECTLLKAKPSTELTRLGHFSASLGGSGEQNAAGKGAIGLWKSHTGWARAGACLYVSSVIGIVDRARYSSFEDHEGMWSMLTYHRAP